MLQNEITEAQLQNSNRLDEEALVQANRNVLNNHYEAQMGLLPGIPGVEPPSVAFELDEGQRHAMAVLPRNPGIQGMYYGYIIVLLYY